MNIGNNLPIFGLVSIEFSVLNRTNDQNSTKINSSECGIHYSDFRDDMDVLYDIEMIADETQSIVLACTYLVCSILAWILVATFMDPLSRHDLFFLIKVINSNSRSLYIIPCFK